MTQQRQSCNDDDDDDDDGDDDGDDDPLIKRVYVGDPIQI